MWRKILTAVLILCLTGAAAPSQTVRGSVTFPINLGANTTWTGHEDLGGYGALRFVFVGSTVTMYDKDGATRGSWDYSNGITMTFYGGRVEYNCPNVPTQACNYARSFGIEDEYYYFHVGVACAAPRMGGQARNTVDGRTWRWNVSSAPMSIEVNGTYDGTVFGFTIPVGNDGRGAGQGILRSQNRNPELLESWRMRLMGAVDWVNP